MNDKLEYSNCFNIIPWDLEVIPWDMDIHIGDFEVIPWDTNLTKNNTIKKGKI